MGHTRVTVLGDTHRSEQIEILAFVGLTAFQRLVSSSVNVGMVILLISGLQGA